MCKTALECVSDTESVTIVLVINCLVLYPETKEIGGGGGMCCQILLNFNFTNHSRNENVNYTISSYIILQKQLQYMWEAIGKQELLITGSCINCYRYLGKQYGQIYWN